MSGNTSQNKKDEDTKVKKDGDIKAKEDAIIVMEWFIKLFDRIIIIASLGAGFMFNVILEPVDNDQNNLNDTFSAATVNTLVAVSWLCFILALTFSSAFASFFEFYKNELTTGVAHRRAWAHLTNFFVSLVVQSLVLAGFLTASFVVMAFDEVVGLVSVVFTSLFTLILIGMLMYRLGYVW